MKVTSLGVTCGVMLVDAAASLVILRVLMKMWSAKKFTAVAVGMLALAGWGDQSKAMMTADAAELGARYTLHLHHLHTGESIDIVYKIGNDYVPQAMAKLDYFLRDHRTNDVRHYDPREFDLLHALLGRLGKPAATIDVVCGYRTPWSNNYLRTRSATTGVAKNSQHMQAHAIDIRIPGVGTRALRDAALSLRGGGVGYYPVSQFVHVDVGPVRAWTYGGAE